MPLKDKLLGYLSCRSLRTQIHQLQADKHHVHEGEGRLPPGLWGGQWFLDLLSQLPWQPVRAARKHHLRTAYGQNREDKDDRWVGLWMWCVSGGSTVLQRARALCCCTWRQAELAQVEMNHSHIKCSRRVKRLEGEAPDSDSQQFSSISLPASDLLCVSGQVTCSSLSHLILLCTGDICLFP